MPRSETLRAILCAVMVMMAGCGGGGGGGGKKRVEPVPSPGPTTAVWRVATDAGDTARPVESEPTIELWVTTSLDAGAGSLRQALAVAADDQVIGIAAGLAGATLSPSTTLHVTRSVVIDGTRAPGFTLDGANAHRLLRIDGDCDVRVNGVRFIRGRAVDGSSPGGAIWCGDHGTLQLRHCRFENNVADIGGAVRAGYGTFTTIEDCTFLDNDGSVADNGFSAGAISTYGHGELTVRRCRFERNRGWSGAAIYNLLQPLTVDDSIFLDNQSENDGAAIFTDEGNWVGPSATVGGSIRVRGCWMEGNISTIAGGAMMLWANDLDTVLVQACVLRNNRVDRGGTWNEAKGGAIRTRGILTIRDVAFVGNTAYGQGGALWVDGSGPMRIENSTFSGNAVTDDAGGAMTFNVGDGAEVEMVNCTLVGNSAGRACGAFWLPSSTTQVRVTNSIVSSNTAGSDHAQDQIGHAPLDGGGNIEFPAPVGGGRRVASGGRVLDPRLGAVAESQGTLVHPLQAGSPAINSAIPAKAPATDGRGLERDAVPDCGAYEFNAPVGAS